MTSTFAGLSAFPLTPLHHDYLDEAAFSALMKRLVLAGVDSITALGSTGSYAYLSASERARVAHLAVEHAAGIPVIIGVGALRTSQVFTHIDAAVKAGASGLLLAPMSYQPLTERDVVGLFRSVSEYTDLPVIVYDNPGTTHVTFTNDLYAEVAQLPGIASIKIPGVPADQAAAQSHVAAIRAVIPDQVTVGISGDSCAAAGLNAGCELWYSVLGGTVPQVALELTRAAQAGQADVAVAQSERLAPLWDLFAEFDGSFRVVAVIAQQLGLVQPGCLPLPIQPLSASDQARIGAVVQELGLS
ncbi:MAG: dihydrodipicolinate synthase family protein [Propionibacteriaceae bacterium]